MIREALVGAVLLIGAAGASATQVERVTDGSFELGSPQWMSIGAIHCSAATCGAPAATGSFYWSTGFTFESVPADSGFNNIGSLTQSVVVPESPATLRFDLRVFDGSEPMDVFLNVTLGSTSLAVIDSGSPTFEPVSLPIPAGLIGFGSNELKFEVICVNLTFADKECERVDIDDVSLLTPEPAAFAQGLVSTALLAASARHRIGRKRSCERDRGSAA